MLDQEDRDAEPVADGADEGAERRHLSVVEPARGLVHEEQLGLGREGAGRLHPLERGEGQARRRHMGDRLQAHETDRLQGGFPVGPLLPQYARPPEGTGEEAAPRPAMGPDHHVVQHRHGAEERQVLEGTPDAQPRDVVGLGLQEIVLLKGDGACRGLIEPAQAVEQGGLTGAIRADEAHDLARLMLNDTSSRATMPPKRTPS